tara:strand:+ start:881 stop:1138 length:258 start_codon:yes stop_codon:yes gene_type:complete
MIEKSTLIPGMIEMAEQSLIIGNNNVHEHVMVDKVRKDIEFINTKIIYVESQRNPNDKIIKTYKAMLESRYSVLEWLEKNDHTTI